MKKKKRSPATANDAQPAPPAPPSAESPWTVERKVNAFEYLYRDAQSLHLRAATADVEESARLSRTAILLYVLSLEGLVNRATAAFLKSPFNAFYRDREKDHTTEEKWRLLPMLAANGATFDTGESSWAQFNELISLRNEIAHPKSRRGTYYRVTDKEWIPVQEEKEKPERLDIQRIVYPNTGIPTDPSAVRLARLDTAKAVVDTMVRKLDDLLGGKLRETPDGAIPENLEQTSWLYRHELRVIDPPGATVDSLVRPKEAANTASAAVPPEVAAADVRPSESREAADPSADDESLEARLVLETASLTALIERVRPLIEERSLSGVDIVKQPWFTMLTCFAVKQLEHARSVLSLNHTSDAGLIARSVLEGTAILTFVSSDSVLRDERALRWMEFDAVRTFSEARQRAEIEAANDGSEKWEQRRADTLAQLEAAKKELAKVGEKFWTPKAKRAAKEGKPLPDDPFVANWHDLSSIKRNSITSRPFAALFMWEVFSQMHHFEARMFARSISVRGDDVTIDLHRVSGRITATHCADVGAHSLEGGRAKGSCRINVPHFCSRDSGRKFHCEQTGTSHATSDSDARLPPPHAMRPFDGIAGIS